MFSLLYICPLRENQRRILKSLALNLRVVRKSKRSLRVFCSIIAPRVKIKKRNLYIPCPICIRCAKIKEKSLYFLFLFVCNNVHMSKEKSVLRCKTCLGRKGMRNKLIKQKFVYSLFCKPFKAC